MGLLLSRGDWGKYLDRIESCHILCLSYFLCPKDARREHAAGTNASLVPKTALVQLSVEEAKLPRGGRIRKCQLWQQRRAREKC